MVFDDWLEDAMRREWVRRIGDPHAFTFQTTDEGKLAITANPAKRPNKARRRAAVVEQANPSPEAAPKWTLPMSMKDAVGYFGRSEDTIFREYKKRPAIREKVKRGMYKFDLSDTILAGLRVAVLRKQKASKPKTNGPKTA